MQDALNRDLPSDRLLVEWQIHDIERTPIPLAAPRTILRTEEGTPELRLDAMQAGAPLAIEIPHDLQAIKREAPHLAMEWRLAVRQAFSASFDLGWVACDFQSGAYLLLPREERAHED
jgi:predicted GNAT superfamily acetyltransferase